MPADELNALDAPARKLVEAVGIAGRPIPLDVAAALIDAPPDETLEIGERLMAGGFLAASGDSFTASGDRSGSLTSIRMAYLYSELARAFIDAGYATRSPGLLGDYYLRAGDVEAAVPLIGTAAEGGATEDVIDLIDAGVTAIEEEGVGTPELEARLRLERGKYYQTAGWTDQAAEDFKIAARFLVGPSRVDALGFLAAIEDNRQESQTAEVYAAAAIGEATAIEEPLKAGSLLSLQARILHRVGFPSEADASLLKGAGVLEERGNSYQRFLATQNTGRIALDRGNALRAQPLLDRAFTTAEGVAGLGAATEAAVWLARAQYMHGQPDRGLESVGVAMELAEASATSGPVFFAHQAHAEGADRFGAYGEALEQADLMLEVVLEQSPQWENAARYLRARAFLGLGRVEEAAEEVERALELTPAGINGWRWRLRIKAFRFNVLAAQGAEWAKARAEDLTDELLQGHWLDIAAELMAVRAGVEEDPELAKQSAALALQLGVPTTAATAIEAGGLWGDPAAAAVASRVKETQRHVPEAWLEDWSSQPGIAAGLAAPDVVDEELAAAAATLQADLDAALLAAGLADPDTALSPAQRREQGLVRRAPSRARRGALLLGAAAAVVILAIGGGIFGASIRGSDQTTTTTTTETTSPVASPPRMEDTQITTDIPVFTNKWVTLGGNQARTGATDATGVRDPEGYYWKNEESGDQFQASPIVIGQNLIVGARDGQVYFMGLRNGEVAKVSLPTGDVESTAAGAQIGGQWLAFVPNRDGFLYAYDVQTADEVGFHQIDTGETPAFEESTERLYVADRDGFLHALNAADLRKEVWIRPATDGGAEPITTAITLADRKLFYGVGGELWQVDLDALERNLALLEADPDTLESELEIERRLCDADTRGTFLTPVVSGAHVYAANTDRLIHILDTETCAATEFFITIGETPLSRPAVSGNRLYQTHSFGVSSFIFGTRDEVAGLVPNLSVAEDPNAGESRQQWWNGPIQASIGSVRSSPVIADDLVYVGSNDNHVYALEPNGDSLEIVWQWDTGAQIVASVAVIDRAVYVATAGGEVIAIAPVVKERVEK